MGTNRADIGSSSADNDVSAVAAFPYTDATLLENFGCFDIVQQGTVTLLMTLFDGSHTSELLSQFMEAFFIGFTGKGVVHVCPFVILTFSSMKQILGSRANSTQMLEPQFGMFFLILGGLEEEGGYLLVTVLLGNGGILGVFVPCH